MNTTTVQAVVAAAQQLSPPEQLEVIRALTHLLQRHSLISTPMVVPLPPPMSIPVGIRRTPPVTDMTVFAADFWPNDETADDITTYITQQRMADR